MSEDRALTENIERPFYRCCNTCKHQDNSFYGCAKADRCYNGFSAYEGIKKTECIGGDVGGDKQ